MLRRMLALAFAAVLAGLPAQAADRARIEAFLEVTGFDVALDSIALSAGSAPELLGIDAGAFGSEWTRLSQEVFDTGQMRGQAIGILEETLEDQALNHAVDFYASDLGQRLVKAENASHLVEDDETKQAAGERLISDMVQGGSPRLELLKRMGQAIDAGETGLKALQLIQFRFLMAASAAGVIELQLDADGLRALMKEQEPNMRVAIRMANMASSAYTYQEFSDAEIEAYVAALEHPQMQTVYELLNAVQYEITANRFEELAYRMKDLERGQDI
ncbi:DUF2059 domain-containing protein [Roseobacteraceae bacterium NS-SX3]